MDPLDILARTNSDFVVQSERLDFMQSSTFSSFGLSTTQKLLDGDDSHGNYQKMREELIATLAQKTQEFNDLQVEAEAEEQKLESLKAELEQQKLEYQQVMSMKEEPEPEFKLDEIRKQHEEEINELKAKQEEEIGALKMQYQKALADAEATAIKHNETIILEKKSELEELQNQLTALRNSRTERMLSATQTAAKSQMMNATISKTNTEKISALQRQIQECAIASREDLREIRAKIDECLVTIELRDHEHQNEVAKYQREIQTRQSRYAEHLQALKMKQESEIERIQSSIAAEEAKHESLLRVQKQIEAQQIKQLKITQKDNEKLRAALAAAKANYNDSFRSTLNQTGPNVYSLQRQIREISSEIAAIEEETNEINEENIQLQAQLQRLGGKIRIRN